MISGARPALRPARPQFSSGPCAKRPGWSLSALDAALLGRSHRAPAARARLEEVVARSRALLGMPKDWRLGIVPGSDTGAIEMAMWSLLGPRPVDVLAFDSFSRAWADDITRHLRLDGVRVLAAPYGELPDLASVDPAHDVVLAWNGTTSGVRMPHGDWIAPDRAGLVLADATSAAFAMPLPWDRLDVATWSWQKALGGEGAHGMLALSPRAAERLQGWSPPWPVPKLFRLNEAVFTGETINTPSLLCVEDALDGLRWAERIGGLPALIARSEANLACVAAWVARSDRARFLAANPASRSCTAICLRAEGADPRRMAALLEQEGVGYDLLAHRDAPPGLRIWGGATIDTADISALLPWLDWAYAQCRHNRTPKPAQS